MNHAVHQLAPQVAEPRPDETADQPRPRTRDRRGLHRGAAVIVLCFAFALAGQTVAQAATSVQTYQAYALQQLGGNTTQSSCLTHLWQRGSGWHPNARNPHTSAYGIAQFLNSTWASSGIAKTSTPCRQIDSWLS